MPALRGRLGAATERSRGRPPCAALRGDGASALSGMRANLAAALLGVLPPFCCPSAQVAAFSPQVYKSVCRRGAPRSVASGGIELLAAILLAALHAAAQPRFDAAAARAIWSARPNSPATSINLAALAAAGLLADAKPDDCAKFLQAALSLQSSSGKSKGLFAWVKDGQPSVEATVHAMPLLAAAWLSGAGRLDASLRQAIAASLESAALALVRNRADREADVRRLTAAAAWAAAAACGLDRYRTRAAACLTRWLAEFSRHGLQDCHGPSTEAYRLAALAWLRAFGVWRDEAGVAEKLLCADIAARLHGQGPALAGPYLFTAGGADMQTLLGPLRWMTRQPQPQQLPPEAAYFTLPARHGLDIAAACKAMPVPRELTYARSGQWAYTEHVYIDRNFSLGTLTGAVGPSSAPVLITWASEAHKASWAAASTVCRFFTFQRGGVALVVAEFDYIGATPARRNAWVDFYFGPPDAIKRTWVLRSDWPGQAAAVGSRWPVTVQTPSGCVGIVPLWCGPAAKSPEDIRTQPGVLEWAELPGGRKLLRLRLHARRADYLLRRPMNDAIVSFVVAAAGKEQTTLPGLAAWLMRVRGEREVVAKKRRLPQKDQGHPVLDKYKPKPKAALAYERWRELHVTLIVGGEKWEAAIDLTREKVLHFRVNGKPMELPAPWATTPLFKAHCPWSWKALAASLPLAKLFPTAQAGG